MINLLFFLLLIIPSLIYAENTQPSIFSGSVNVITGEFRNNAEDIHLSGPKQIQLQRIFHKDSINSWIFNHPCFLLEKNYEEDEKTPYNYSFDTQNRLNQISFWNNEKTKKYHELNFSYESDDDTHSTCIGRLQDGRAFSFSYRLNNDNRHETALLIDSFTNFEGGKTNYFYIDHPSERNSLLKKIEDPEGGFLELEYYSGKHNNVGGTLISFENGLRDLRIGRVKLLKAPLGPGNSVQITQSFFYNEGYTDIHYSNDRVERYYFSNDGNITSIETSLDKNQREKTLYKIEKFSWLDSLLISKTLSNGNGLILSCHTNSYDSNRNLIESRVYGSITGKAEESLMLDDKGHPNHIHEYSSTKFEYDQKQRLIRKLEPSGKITEYVYDEKDREIAIFISGDGIHIRQFYEYNSDGLLTCTITDDGISKEKEDLTSLTERHKIIIHLCDENPGMGMPSQIEEYYLDCTTGNEIFSKKTLYTYSYNNQITSQLTIGSDGSLIGQAKYEYDSMNRCILKDEDGNKSTYDFDLCGRITKECKSIKGEQAIDIYYFYDVAGRLFRKVEKKEGQIINADIYKYDGRNNCIASIDYKGHETKYLYDALNRKIATISPAVKDDEGNFVNPMTKFNYDLWGNIIEIIDPKGYKTLTRYSIQGKPLEIIYPDGTKEHFYYNLDGTLSKKIHKNGLITLYFWDALGRLIKEVNQTPSNKIISWNQNNYNSFHLLESINHRGCQIKQEFYPSGVLKEVKRGSGDKTITIQYEYFPDGSIHKESCYYGMNANDGFIKIYDADKNIETYDLKGNLLKVEKAKSDDKIEKTNDEVDDEGNIIKIDYDALGRSIVIKKINPLGHILNETLYFYDLSNNPVKEIHNIFVSNEKKGEYIIQRKYGAGNRLESIVEGVGSRAQRTSSYLYNEHGLLETIINPNRISIHHFYNEMGLLYRFYANDGSFDYEYFYDNNGNVVAVQDCITGNSTEYAFDNSGNVCFEKLANGISLSFECDALGRNTSLCLPDGSLVKYNYSSIYLKEIARFTSKDQKLYEHHLNSYNLDGKIKNETLIQNLGIITYDYNANGFCTEINTPFFNEKILLMEKNNQSVITEKRINDFIGRQISTFLYDPQQQLIQECAEYTNKFSYDSIGNRLSENEIEFNINQLNQVTYDGFSSYEYDINGNLIKTKSCKQTKEFNYDALNRLISVIINDSVKVSYTYDSLSRRLSKTLFSKNNDHWNEIDFVNFIYCGDKEIGSMNSKGTIEYLRVLNPEKSSEIGSSIAIEINSELFAPIHDLQGSIVTLVNATTAKIKECYRYTAFGKEKIYNEDKIEIDSFDATNPYRFCSKRKDNESGLIYFGKRYYSPELARWISLDRAGFIDGLNRYTYVHNNPLSNVDHFGFFSFSSFWQKICSFFSEIKNIISNVVESISFEKKISHTIQSKFMHSFETYFGKGFLTLVGYYTHSLESGTYGQSEASNFVRITAINGILNTRDYFAGTLEFLTKIHGGNNIHYVFRPTLGWSNDLLQGLFIKLGFVSSYAKELASTWRKLINDMGGVNSCGKIIHYCHSLGGADTISAASLLTPEERKMIDVISFGSASLISNQVGFQHVINYVSLRDGVSLFADPCGYFNGIFKKNTNLIFIGSFIGFPLIDHPLAVESYTQTITNLGYVFMKMYANCM